MLAEAADADTRPSEETRNCRCHHGAALEDLQHALLLQLLLGSFHALRELGGVQGLLDEGGGYVVRGFGGDGWSPLVDLMIQILLCR